MKGVSLNAQAQHFFSHGYLTERHRLAQWETLKIHWEETWKEGVGIADNADWTGLLSVLMGAGRKCL